MATTQTINPVSKISSVERSTTPSSSRGNAFIDVLENTANSSLKNIPTADIYSSSTQSNLPAIKKDISYALTQVKTSFLPTFSRRNTSDLKNTSLDKAADAFSIDLALAGRKEKNDFYVGTKLPNSNGFTLPLTARLADEVGTQGMIKSLQGCGRMFAYVKKSNPVPYSFG